MSGIVSTDIIVDVQERKKDPIILLTLEELEVVKIVQDTLEQHGMPRPVSSIIGQYFHTDPEPEPKKESIGHIIAPVRYGRPAEQNNLCTKLFIYGLQLAHIIAGIIILEQTSSMDRGSCGAMWAYAIYSVIVIFTMCCARACLMNEGYEQHNAIFAILIISKVAHVIWGIIIWQNLVHGKCDVVRNEQPQLVTFFMVTFWFDIAALGLLGLVCVCACLSLYVNPREH
jgi:hypothetical protein